MNKGSLQFFTISLALFIWAFTGVCYAQGDTVTIVEHITAIEGNTVSQPSSLNKLIAPAQAEVETPQDQTTSQTKDTEKAQEKEREPEKPRVHTPTVTKMAGYRVQVYSDGNQRTAKAQAQQKAAMVSSRFPHMRTYASYSAPFWRLRVGDFRTRREADNAAASLRSAFPSFRNEIRVVRDRINAID